MDIQQVIKSLSIAEKASLCTGGDFWHTRAIENKKIPAVMMCDGPHGLRKQQGEADHMGINASIETVCYPTASALGSSFDTALMQTLGEMLADECQAEEVGMLLGPGLNIKRSPLCGRNFEYFSEDPYVTGKLASSYIKSLQKNGVAACVKHFAANNQETHRMSGSSNMGERTLREIYLPAFEIAVRDAEVKGVMCAYNAINGTFCAENKRLLTDILRGEWGFDGFVVTDWGAAKDVVKGLEAGTDLVMPGGVDAYTDLIVEAVNSGNLAEEVLDQTVDRILRFVFDSIEKKKEEAEIDRKKARQTSAYMATQCAVLLKNDYALPLHKNQKVAFIGEFAKKPRYQGNGSSYVNVPQVCGAMDVVQDRNVVYAQGYHAGSDKCDERLMLEAIETAKTAEYAVIFAGLPNSYEAEGFDRTSLDIPENQNQLIEKIAEVQPNTIVVLHGGAPMALSWINQVKAVLCMYLGGEGVGEASVRLLYGEENPSGKLAETWPLKLSHTPAHLNFPGVDGNVDYQEGIYVGYRYYDKKEMDVLFPFGYGLSYTSFAYSNLQIDQTSITDQDTIKVTCRIKNTGLVKGKEVVQLYVRDVESEVGRPLRELKGFEKVTLEPGEEKNVTFILDKRSFAYYEEKIQDWFVESGKFAIEIGSSSRNICLSEEIEVKSTRELPYSYTSISPISSLLKTAKGRIFFKEMMANMQEESGKEQSMDALGEAGTKIQQAMMMEMPLGALIGYGQINMEDFSTMLEELNCD